MLPVEADEPAEGVPPDLVEAVGGLMSLPRTRCRIPRWIGLPRTQCLPRARCWISPRRQSKADV